MLDTIEVFEKHGSDLGWDTLSRLELALEFIQKEGRAYQFEQFLAEQAHEERVLAAYLCDMDVDALTDDDELR
jgi:hypothetical protein